MSDKDRERSGAKNLVDIHVENSLRKHTTHLARRLGFSPHAYVEAFEETELRFVATPSGAERIRAQTARVETAECRPPPEDAS